MTNTNGYRGSDTNGPDELEAGPPPKTLAQLAKEAIEVQDACNLSGVVHGFSRALTRLREIAHAEGWESTDEINLHPICVMWSSKIASLTSSDSSRVFSAAYEIVKDLASGGALTGRVRARAW